MNTAAFYIQRRFACGVRTWSIGFEPAAGPERASPALSDDDYRELLGTQSRFDFEMSVRTTAWGSFWTSLPRDVRDVLYQELMEGAACAVPARRVG